MIQLILTAIAYGICIAMSYFVVVYVKNKTSYNLNPADITKGQKIVAKYKGKKYTARVTFNFRDSRIIYGVTPSRKPKHIRVEYPDILKVNK